jgi:hypothetical protein
MSSFEYTNTRAASGDGANQLLTKILQRLNWNASVTPDVPSANVVVTNTPLTVSDPQALAQLVSIHAHLTNIDGTTLTSNGHLATIESYLYDVGTASSAAFSLAQMANILVNINDGVYIRDYVTSQRAAVTDDGHLSVVSSPFSFEVSHSGSYGIRAAQIFRILGRRAGFNSTSVLQDVGEWLATSINTFPELAGTEALEVVSNSVQDDGPAGTGTHSVRIVYLNTGYAMQVLDVVLDGTTPVGLGAVRMRYVYWMEALTGGTSEISDGNIDLRTVAGSVIQERISAGGNKSLSARFMVPDGYEAFMSDWEVSTIGGTQDARLRATVQTDSRALASRYVFQDTFMTAADGGMVKPLPYFKLPARTRIKISTLAGTAAVGNRIQGAFTIVLVVL